MKYAECPAAFIEKGSENRIAEINLIAFAIGAVSALLTDKKCFFFISLSACRI